MSKTPVVFQYAPQTYTTADAVFELRTSEFDFQPQEIRLVGNADPQILDVQAYMANESMELPDENDSSLPK